MSIDTGFCESHPAPLRQGCRVEAVGRGHVWAWGLDLITKAHVDSRGTYGARRVHAELTIGHGFMVGHNAVEMLMRRAGLQGLPNKRRFKTKVQVATATDLVKQSFARSEPDQLWVTDITEHRTREGKVYCSVVPDVFSHRVVGWSIDAAPTSVLVTNALGRRPITVTPMGRSYIRTTGRSSPRGRTRAVRSTPDSFRRWGSIGDCYDNAVIESFWARMQVELLDHQRWSTRVELANAIFDYLEIFHNRRRRHSALGTRTPVEYETMNPYPTQVA